MKQEPWQRNDRVGSASGYGQLVERALRERPHGPFEPDPEDDVRQGAGPAPWEVWPEDTEAILNDEWNTR